MALDGIRGTVTILGTPLASNPQVYPLAAPLTPKLPPISPWEGLCIVNYSLYAFFTLNW